MLEIGVLEVHTKKQAERIAATMRGWRRLNAQSEWMVTREVRQEKYTNKVRVMDSAWIAIYTRLAYVFASVGVKHRRIYHGLRLTADRA
jgi:hypothetical protein